MKCVDVHKLKLEKKVVKKENLNCLVGIKHI